MADANEIDREIRQALVHLETALNLSIAHVTEEPRTKEEIGRKWGFFLGEFMGLVREKGKQSKLNLLSWISFPRGAR